MKKRRNRSKQGGSILEMTLLMPWFIFLFVGAFDWGFYAHALISVESAARVAALYGSAASGGNVSATTACTYVLGELNVASNVVNVSNCSASPVQLSRTCTTLAGLNAVQMAVTYQTLSLIPIPGLLNSQFTLYRFTELPMQDNNTCTAVS
jgi:Flp pilus assembly protein TadG